MLLLSLLVVASGVFADSGEFEDRLSRHGRRRTAQAGGVENNICLPRQTLVCSAEPISFCHCHVLTDDKKQTAEGEQKLVIRPKGPGRRPPKPKPAPKSPKPAPKTPRCPRGTVQICNGKRCKCRPIDKSDHCEPGLVSFCALGVCICVVSVPEGGTTDQNHVCPWPQTLVCSNDPVPVCQCVILRSDHVQRKSAAVSHKCEKGTHRECGFFDCTCVPDRRPRNSWISQKSAQDSMKSHKGCPRGTHKECNFFECYCVRDTESLISQKSAQDSMKSHKFMCEANEKLACTGGTDFGSCKCVPRRRR